MLDEELRSDKEWKGVKTTATTSFIRSKYGLRQRRLFSLFLCIMARWESFSLIGNQVSWLARCPFLSSNIMSVGLLGVSFFHRISCRLACSVFLSFMERCVGRLEWCLILSWSNMSSCAQGESTGREVRPCFVSGKIRKWLPIYSY